MKNLDDFEEEIYKCSRCGLCQTVCPVYKVTLNECSVSRTKFNMLNGIIKGDLSLNKRILEYMDMCLGCNACKEFCPSNIDAREIFTAVKAQYYKQHHTVFSSYFLFKTILLSAKYGLLLYRFLKFDKITEFLSGKTKSKLLKRILLANTLARTNATENIKAEIQKEKTKKAVYFKGCFNKYLNNDSETAVKFIFLNTDIELIEPDFECCGISHLSSGYEKEFVKLAKHNLKLIPEDCDYIITDCASCAYVLKSYDKYVSSNIKDRIVSVLDILKNAKITVKDRPLTITAHKPCHDDSGFMEIIKKIENAIYIEAENFDKCCGFSGKFAITHSDISREISKRKAQDFLKTGAGIILTNCPACKLGINQGFIELGNKKPQVLNVIEFIAKYCTVEF